MVCSIKVDMLTSGKYRITRSLCGVSFSLFPLQAIQIRAQLYSNRDLRPNFIDARKVIVCIHNRRVLIRCGDDFRPGIHSSCVAPSLIFAVWVSGWGYSGHKALCINGSSSLEQLPMCGTSGGVESTWIKQHTAACLPEQHCQIRESNIIANANATFPVRSIECCQVLARRECVGFPKCYFAWNIDIEKVHFSVLGKYLSVRTVHHACIVDLAGCVTLRDRSCIFDRN
jgi:hypothetical protein